MKNRVENETTESEPNPYYVPNFWDVLSTFMYLFPLWSGLLIDQHGVNRYSNSSVANHFKIVKRDVLKSKRSFGMVEFILKWLPILYGKLAEASDDIEMNQSRKKGGVKRKSKSVDMNEEQWQKRQRKESTYYEPKEIPPPPKQNTRSDGLPNNGQNLCWLNSFIQCVRYSSLQNALRCKFLIKLITYAV